MSSTKRIGWLKKLVFGLATSITFFVGVEVVLMIIGVQPLAFERDPLVGFSSQIPLLEPAQDSDGSPLMRVRQSKRVWFNDQSFPAVKEKNTRRIFCLGGSTTYGRPFDDTTSYCGWLRELLPVVAPSKRWEVINAGGISYASYRVAAVMEELADYEPDLFLIYSAHNEFLERRTYASLMDTPALQRELTTAVQRTRTGSLIHRLVNRDHLDAFATAEMLPAEVDEMLNHSMGPIDYHRDDPWHDKVISHYQLNVQRMIQIAKQAGAEIIFVAPASNLKDCWPFKSERPREDSEQVEASTLGITSIDAIAQLIEQRSFEEAHAACESLLAAQPRNAAAHFYRGRALFGLGQHQAAESAFQRAIDEDICPLRATSPIAESLRRTADAEQIPLVDFELQLKQSCNTKWGHRCLGQEQFLDHVHPTIDVHGELAVWIMHCMQQQTTMPLPKLPTTKEIESVRNHVWATVDDQTRGVAFRNLAKVMHWAGKYNEAFNHARDALKLIPGDLESQYLVADCLLCRGQRDEALSEFGKLFAMGEFPKGYLPYGELLLDSGRLGEATAFLLPATLNNNPARRDRAYYALAIAHVGLTDFDAALESIGQLSPEYREKPATRLLESESWIGLGEHDKAIQTLRFATEQHPDHPELHYRLGMELLSQQRLSEAKRQLEITLQIDPDDDRALSAMQVAEAILDQAKNQTGQ